MRSKMIREGEKLHDLLSEFNYTEQNCKDCSYFECYDMNGSISDRPSRCTFFKAIELQVEHNGHGRCDNFKAD